MIETQPTPADRAAMLLTCKRRSAGCRRAFSSDGAKRRLPGDDAAEKSSRQSC